MLSLRIVNINYYVAKPIVKLDPLYSVFRGLPISKVPIIQIFGTTSGGQKCCLHLHGVFPYILVPYDGSINLDQLLHQLAQSLDKAINISFGKAESDAHHVFNIVSVSGIPFYGFHAKPHIFVKIFFYDPCIIKKAAALLENGAVLNTTFQPYEAHVPYVLQCMIDNNLHGMNFIFLSTCMFRRSPDVNYCSVESDQGTDDVKDITSDSVNPSKKILNLNNIPEKYLLPDSVQRDSVCELEIDALVTDVTNRNLLSDESGRSANPGLTYIWEDEMSRQNETDKSKLLPPPSPPRFSVVPSESQLHFKELLIKKLNAQVPISESKADSATLELNLPIESTAEVTISPFECSTIDLPTENNVMSSKNNISQDESFNNESHISIFNNTQNSSWMDSQDKDLLDVMFKLAVGSQAKHTEDHDATLSAEKLSSRFKIYSGSCQDSSSDSENETLLMSQRIWTQEPIIVNNFSNNDDVKNSSGENSISNSNYEGLPQYDGGNDYYPDKKNFLSSQKHPCNSNTNYSLLRDQSSSKPHSGIPSSSIPSFSRKSNDVNVQCSSKKSTRDYSHDKIRCKYSDNHLSSSCNSHTFTQSVNIVPIGLPRELPGVAYVLPALMTSVSSVSGTKSVLSKSKNVGMQHKLTKRDITGIDSKFSDHLDIPTSKDKSYKHSNAAYRSKNYLKNSSVSYPKKKACNTDILMTAWASINLDIDGTEVEASTNISHDSFSSHSSRQMEVSSKKTSTKSKMSPITVADQSNKLSSQNLLVSRNSRAVKSKTDSGDSLVLGCSTDNFRPSENSLRKEKLKNASEQFALPPLESFSDCFNEVYDRPPQTPGNFLAEDDLNLRSENFNSLVTSCQIAVTPLSSFSDGSFIWKQSELSSKNDTLRLRTDEEPLHSTLSQNDEQKDQFRHRGKKDVKTHSKKCKSKVKLCDAKVSDRPNSKSRVKIVDKMKMLFGSPSPPKTLDNPFSFANSPTYMDKPPTPGGEEIFPSLPDDPLNLATITDNFDSFKEHLANSSYLDSVDPKPPLERPLTPEIHTSIGDPLFEKVVIKNYSSIETKSSFHADMEKYPMRPLTPGRENSLCEPIYHFQATPNVSSENVQLNTSFKVSKKDNRKNELTAIEKCSNLTSTNEKYESETMMKQGMNSRKDMLYKDSTINNVSIIKSSHVDVSNIKSKNNLVSCQKSYGTGTNVAGTGMKSFSTDAFTVVSSLKSCSPNLDSKSLTATFKSRSPQPSATSLKPCSSKPSISLKSQSVRHSATNLKSHSCIDDSMKAQNHLIKCLKSNTTENDILNGKSSTADTTSDIANHESITSLNTTKDLKEPIYCLEEDESKSHKSLINLKKVLQNNKTDAFGKSLKKVLPELNFSILDGPVPMTSPMPYTPAAYQGETFLTTEGDSSATREFDFNKAISSSNFHVGTPVSPLGDTPFTNRMDFSMEIIPSVGSFNKLELMSPLAQTPLQNSNCLNDLKDDALLNKKNVIGLLQNSTPPKSESPSTACINVSIAYPSIGPLMSPLPQTPSHYKDFSVPILSKNSISLFPMTSPIPDTPKHDFKTRIPLLECKNIDVKKKESSAFPCELTFKENEDELDESTINFSCNKSDPTIEAAVAALNFEEPLPVELPSSYAIEIVDCIDGSEQDASKEKDSDVETTEEVNNDIEGVLNGMQYPIKDSDTDKPSLCKPNLPLNPVQDDKHAQSSNEYISLELLSDFSKDAIEDPIVSRQDISKEYNENNLMGIQPTTINESSKGPVDLLQTICEESFGIPTIVPDDVSQINVLTTDAPKMFESSGSAVTDQISSFCDANESIQLPRLDTVSDHEHILTSPIANAPQVAYFDLKSTSSKVNDVSTIVTPTFSSSSLLTSLVRSPTEATLSPGLAIVKATIPLSVQNCDYSLLSSSSIAPKHAAIEQPHSIYVAPSFDQKLSSMTVPHPVEPKDWPLRKLPYGAPKFVSSQTISPLGRYKPTNKKLDAMLVAGRAKFTEKSSKSLLKSEIHSANPFTQSIATIQPVCHFGNSTMLNISPYSQSYVPLQPNHVSQSGKVVNNKVSEVNISEKPIPSSTTLHFQANSKFIEPNVVSYTSDIFDLTSVHSNPLKVDDSRIFQDANTAKIINMEAPLNNFQPNNDLVSVLGGKKNLLALPGTVQENFLQSQLNSVQYPLCYPSETFGSGMNIKTTTAVKEHGRKQKENTFSSPLDEAHTIMQEDLLKKPQIPDKLLSFSERKEHKESYMRGSSVASNNYVFNSNANAVSQLVRGNTERSNIENELVTYDSTQLNDPCMFPDGKTTSYQREENNKDDLNTSLQHKSLTKPLEMSKMSTPFDAFSSTICTTDYALSEDQAKNPFGSYHHSLLRPWLSPNETVSCTIPTFNQDFTPSSCDSNSERIVNLQVPLTMQPGSCKIFDTSNTIPIICPEKRLISNSVNKMNCLSIEDNLITSPHSSTLNSKSVEHWKEIPVTKFSVCKDSISGPIVQTQYVKKNTFNETSPSMETDPKSVDSLGSVAAELVRPFSGLLHHSSMDQSEPAPLNHMRVITGSPLAPSRESSCISDASQENSNSANYSPVGAQTSPLSLVLNRQFNDSPVVRNLSRQMLVNHVQELSSECNTQPFVRRAVSVNEKPIIVSSSISCHNYSPSLKDSATKPVDRLHIQSLMHPSKSFHIANTVIKKTEISSSLKPSHKFIDHPIKSHPPSDALDKQNLIKKRVHSIESLHPPPFPYSYVPTMTTKQPLNLDNYSIAQMSKFSNKEKAVDVWSAASNLALKTTANCVHKLHKKNVISPKITVSEENSSFYKEPVNHTMFCGKKLLLNVPHNIQSHSQNFPAIVNSNTLQADTGELFYMKTTEQCMLEVTPPSISKAFDSYGHMNLRDFKKEQYFSKSGADSSNMLSNSEYNFPFCNQESVAAQNCINEIKKVTPFHPGITRAEESSKLGKFLRRIQRSSVDLSRSDMDVNRSDIEAMNPKSSVEVSSSLIDAKCQDFNAKRQNMVNSANLHISRPDREFTTKTIDALRQSKLSLPPLDNIKESGDIASLYMSVNRPEAEICNAKSSPAISNVCINKEHPADRSKTAKHIIDNNAGIIPADINLPNMKFCNKSILNAVNVCIDMSKDEVDVSKSNLKMNHSSTDISESNIDPASSVMSFNKSNNDIGRESSSHVNLFKSCDVIVPKTNFDTLKLGDDMNIKSIDICEIDCISKPNVNTSSSELETYDSFATITRTNVQPINQCDTVSKPSTASEIVCINTSKMDLNTEMTASTLVSSDTSVHNYGAEFDSSIQHLSSFTGNDYYQSQLQSLSSDCAELQSMSVSRVKASSELPILSHTSLYNLPNETSEHEIQDFNDNLEPKSYHNNDSLHLQSSEQLKTINDEDSSSFDCSISVVVAGKVSTKIRGGVLSPQKSCVGLSNFTENLNLDSFHLESSVIGEMEQYENETLPELDKIRSPCLYLSNCDATAKFSDNQTQDVDLITDNLPHKDIGNHSPKYAGVQIFKTTENHPLHNLDKHNYGDDDNTYIETRDDTANQNNVDVAKHIHDITDNQTPEALDNQNSNKFNQVPKNKENQTPIDSTNGTDNQILEKESHSHTNTNNQTFHNANNLNSEEHCNQVHEENSNQTPNHTSNQAPDDSNYLIPDNGSTHTLDDTGKIALLNNISNIKKDSLEQHQLQSSHSHSNNTFELNKGSKPFCVLSNDENVSVDEDIINDSDSDTSIIAGSPYIAGRRSSMSSDNEAEVDLNLFSNEETIVSPSRMNNSYSISNKLQTSDALIIKFKQNSYVCKSMPLVPTKQDSNEFINSLRKKLTRSKGAQKAYPEDFFLCRPNQPKIIPIKEMKKMKELANPMQKLISNDSLNFVRPISLPSPMTTQSRRKRTCANKSYSKFFYSDISSPASGGPQASVNLHQLPPLHKKPRGRPKKMTLASKYSMKATIQPATHCSAISISTINKHDTENMEKSTCSRTEDSLSSKERQSLDLSTTKQEIKLPSTKEVQPRYGSENIVDNNIIQLNMESFTMPSNPRDPLGIETLETGPSKKRRKGKLRIHKKSDGIHKWKSKRKTCSFVTPFTPIHSSLSSCMSSDLVPYTPVHRIDYRGPGTTPASYHENGLKLRLKRKQRKIILRIKCPSLVASRPMQSDTCGNVNMDDSVSIIKEKENNFKKSSQYYIPPLVIKKNNIQNFSSSFLEGPSYDKTLSNQVIPNQSNDSVNPSSECLTFPLKSKKISMVAEKNIPNNQVKADIRMPLKIKIKTSHDKELLKLADCGQSFILPKPKNIKKQTIFSNNLTHVSTSLTHNVDSVEKELVEIFGSPNKQADRLLPEQKCLNDEELKAILSPIRHTVVTQSTKEPNANEILPLNLTKKSDLKLDTFPKVILSSLTSEDIQNWKISDPVSDYYVPKLSFCSQNFTNNRLPILSNSDSSFNIPVMQQFEYFTPTRKKSLKHAVNKTSAEVYSTVKHKNRLIRKYETSKESGLVSDKSLTMVNEIFEVQSEDINLLPQKSDSDCSSSTQLRPKTRSQSKDDSYIIGEKKCYSTIKSSENNLMETHSEQISIKRPGKRASKDRIDKHNVIENDVSSPEIITNEPKSKRRCKKIYNSVDIVTRGARKIQAVAHLNKKTLPVSTKRNGQQNEVEQKDKERKEMLIPGPKAKKGQVMQNTSALSNIVLLTKDAKESSDPVSNQQSLHKTVSTDFVEAPILQINDPFEKESYKFPSKLQVYPGEDNDNIVIKKCVAMGTYSIESKKLCQEIHSEAKIAQAEQSTNQSTTYDRPINELKDLRIEQDMSVFNPTAILSESSPNNELNGHSSSEKCIEESVIHKSPSLNIEESPISISSNLLHANSTIYNNEKEFCNPNQSGSFPKKIISSRYMSQETSIQDKCSTDIQHAETSVDQHEINIKSISHGASSSDDQFLSLESDIINKPTCSVVQPEKISSSTKHTYSSEYLSFLKIPHNHDTESIVSTLQKPHIDLCKNVCDNFPENESSNTVESNSFVQLNVRPRSTTSLKINSKFQLQNYSDIHKTVYDEIPQRKTNTVADKQSLSFHDMQLLNQNEVGDISNVASELIKRAKSTEKCDFLTPRSFEPAEDSALIPEKSLSKHLQMELFDTNKLPCVLNFTEKQCLDSHIKTDHLRENLNQIEQKHIGMSSVERVFVVKPKIKKSSINLNLVVKCGNDQSKALTKNTSNESSLALDNNIDSDGKSITKVKKSEKLKVFHKYGTNGSPFIVDSTIHVSSEIVEKKIYQKLKAADTSARNNPSLVIDDTISDAPKIIENSFTKEQKLVFEQSETFIKNVSDKDSIAVDDRPTIHDAFIIVKTIFGEHDPIKIVNVMEPITDSPRGVTIDVTKDSQIVIDDKVVVVQSNISEKSMLNYRIPVVKPIIKIVDDAITVPPQKSSEKSVLMNENFVIKKPMKLSEINNDLSLVVASTIHVDSSKIAEKSIIIDQDSIKKKKHTKNGKKNSPFGVDAVSLASPKILDASILKEQITLERFNIKKTVNRRTKALSKTAKALREAIPIIFKDETILSTPKIGRKEILNDCESREVPSKKKPKILTENEIADNNISIIGIPKDEQNRIEKPIIEERNCAKSSPNLNLKLKPDIQQPYTLHKNAIKDTLIADSTVPIATKIAKYDFTKEFSLIEKSFTGEKFVKMPKSLERDASKAFALVADSTICLTLKIAKKSSAKKRRNIENSYAKNHVIKKSKKFIHNKCQKSQIAVDDALHIYKIMKKESLAKQNLIEKHDTEDQDSVKLSTNFNPLVMPIEEQSKTLTENANSNSSVIENDVISVDPKIAEISIAGEPKLLEKGVLANTACTNFSLVVDDTISFDHKIVDKSISCKQNPVDNLSLEKPVIDDQKSAKSFAANFAEKSMSKQNNSTEKTVTYAQNNVKSSTDLYPIERQTITKSTSYNSSLFNIELISVVPEMTEKLMTNEQRIIEKPSTGDPVNMKLKLISKNTSRLHNSSLIAFDTISVPRLAEKIVTIESQPISISSALEIYINKSKKVNEISGNDSPSVSYDVHIAPESAEKLSTSDHRTIKKPPSEEPVIEKPTILAKNARKNTALIVDATIPFAPIIVKNSTTNEQKFIENSSKTLIKKAGNNSSLVVDISFPIAPKIQEETNTKEENLIEMSSSDKSINIQSKSFAKNSGTFCTFVVDACKSTTKELTHIENIYVEDPVIKKSVTIMENLLDDSTLDVNNTTPFSSKIEENLSTKEQGLKETSALKPVNKKPKILTKNAGNDCSLGEYDAIPFTEKIERKLSAKAQKPIEMSSAMGLVITKPKTLTNIPGSYSTLAVDATKPVVPKICGELNMNDGRPINKSSTGEPATKQSKTLTKNASNNYMLVVDVINPVTSKIDENFTTLELSSVQKSSGKEPIINKLNDLPLLATCDNIPDTSMLDKKLSTNEQRSKEISTLKPVNKKLKILVVDVINPVAPKITEKSSGKYQGPCSESSADVPVIKTPRSLNENAGINLKLVVDVTIPIPQNSTTREKNLSKISSAVEHVSQKSNQGNYNTIDVDVMNPVALKSNEELSTKDWRTIEKSSAEQLLTKQSMTLTKNAYNDPTLGVDVISPVTTQIGEKMSTKKQKSMELSSTDETIINSINDSIFVVDVIIPTATIITEDHCPSIKSFEKELANDACSAYPIVAKESTFSEQKTAENFSKFKSDLEELKVPTKLVSVESVLLIDDTIGLKSTLNSEKPFENQSAAKYNILKTVLSEKSIINEHIQAESFSKNAFKDPPSIEECTYSVNNFAEKSIIQQSRPVNVSKSHTIVANIESELLEFDAIPLIPKIGEKIHAFVKKNILKKSEAHTADVSNYPPLVSESAIQFSQKIEERLTTRNQKIREKSCFNKSFIEKPRVVLVTEANSLIMNIALKKKSIAKRKDEKKTIIINDLTSIANSSPLVFEKQTLKTEKKISFSNVKIARNETKYSEKLDINETKSSPALCNAEVSTLYALKPIGNCPIDVPITKSLYTFFPTKLKGNFSKSQRRLLTKKILKCEKSSFKKKLKFNSSVKDPNTSSSKQLHEKSHNVQKSFEMSTGLSKFVDNSSIRAQSLKEYLFRSTLKSAPEHCVTYRPMPCKIKDDNTKFSDCNHHMETVLIHESDEKLSLMHDKSFDDKTKTDNSSYLQVGVNSVSAKNSVLIPDESHHADSVVICNNSKLKIVSKGTTVAVDISKQENELISVVRSRNKQVLSSKKAFNTMIAKKHHILESPVSAVLKPLSSKLFSTFGDTDLEHDKFKIEAKTTTYSNRIKRKRKMSKKTPKCCRKLSLEFQNLQKVSEEIDTYQPTITETLNSDENRESFLKFKHKMLEKKLLAIENSSSTIILHDDKNKDPCLTSTPPKKKKGSESHSYLSVDAPILKLSQETNRPIFSNEEYNPAIALSPSLIHPNDIEEEEYNPMPITTDNLLYDHEDQEYIPSKILRKSNYEAQDSSDTYVPQSIVKLCSVHMSVDNSQANDTKARYEAKPICKIEKKHKSEELEVLLPKFKLRKKMYLSNIGTVDSKKVNVPCHRNVSDSNKVILFKDSKDIKNMQLKYEVRKNIRKKVSDDLFNGVVDVVLPRDLVSSKSSRLIKSKSKNVCSPKITKLEKSIKGERTQNISKVGIFVNHARNIREKLRNKNEIKNNNVNDDILKGHKRRKISISTEPKKAREEMKRLSNNSTAHKQGLRNVEAKVEITKSLMKKKHKSEEKFVNESTIAKLELNMCNLSDKVVKHNKKVNSKKLETTCGREFMEIKCSKFSGSIVQRRHARGMSATVLEYKFSPPKIVFDRAHFLKCVDFCDGALISCDEIEASIVKTSFHSKTISETLLSNDNIPFNGRFTMPGIESWKYWFHVHQDGSQQKIMKNPTENDDNLHKLILTPAMLPPKLNLSRHLHAYSYTDDEESKFFQKYKLLTREQCILKPSTSCSRPMPKLFFTEKLTLHKSKKRL